MRRGGACPARAHLLCLAVLAAIPSAGCVTGAGDELDLAEAGPPSLVEITDDARAASQARASLWPGVPSGKPVRVNAWFPTATGAMHTNRGRHTATLLDDGRVLIAGGLFGISDGFYCEPTYTWTHLASAEIYDPRRGAFLDAAPMSTARIGHTATHLRDGRVLVVGGSDGAPSAEIYDPAADRWQPASPPLAPRARHTATLLADGRVLITGGEDGGSATSSTDLYDPASDTWARGPSLSTPRSDHQATLLRDGRVLITGGIAGVTTDFRHGFTDGPVAATVELFDPAAATWSTAAPLADGVRRLTATLLADGRVLVTGRSGTADVYDPAADAWTAAPGKWGDTPATGTVDEWGQGDYQVGRGVLGEAAARLPDGGVMVSGGLEHIYVASSFGGTICEAGAAAHAQTVYSRVQVYDPVTNTWSPARRLPSARGYHTVTSLQSGRLLVAGGYTFISLPYDAVSTDSAVVYRPAL